MRRLFLIGMLCLMVKVTFSQEQDSIKQYDLDEVVVSATRSNTQLKNIPQKVEKTLKNKGLIEARKQLIMIVGRDTNRLSENQVRIATLETLSENLSDGVIAPLFYYAIGGVPLMFAYKMVNTILKFDFI